MTFKLLEMLKKNLFETIKTTFPSKEFKSGTSIMEINGTMDEKDVARYSYLLNLCSNTGKPFHIPHTLSILERCCMMFSFNDYSLLDRNIFEHDFVGLKDDKTEEFYLYVRINDCDSTELYPYCARGVVFPNVLISPLTISEQSFLCLHMIKTYNQTKCELLRRSKVQAYIDRLSFTRNETNFMINRLVAYYSSLINSTYSELEKYKGKQFYLDNKTVWSIPMVLNRDIDIQLAKCYGLFGLIEKARELYSFYLCYDEEINCLLQLGDKEQAIEKIKARLSTSNKKLSFQDKINYSAYNIKLATLLDDAEYYDRAFEFHRSFEAPYAKGIFLFRKQKFQDALVAFQSALKIAPENEKILFSYACTLKEVGEYQEAADIFERLIGKDIKRLEYHKNLALCHLYRQDLNKCMETLRTTISLDPTCVELFFQLALANDRKRDILWTFSKLDMSEATKLKVERVLQQNSLDIKELENCIYSNPRLRPFLKDLFFRKEN